MSERFDAIIIGAGQAGPSLAGRLTGAGMKVAIIERKLFGGTCVNTGCMPTKTLVASAYAAHLARRAAEYGVRIAGEIAVDMRAVKARKDAVMLKSRNGVEAWLKGMESCTVYQGHARFAAPHEVDVGERAARAPSASSSMSAAAPSSPTCRASTRSRYLTNSSILELDALPRHLVDHRRQLYRARIRADVSPLRQRGDGRRERRRG